MHWQSQFSDVKWQLKYTSSYFPGCILFKLLSPLPSGLVQHPLSWCNTLVGSLVLPLLCKNSTLTAIWHWTTLIGSPHGWITIRPLCTQISSSCSFIFGRPLVTCSFVLLFRPSLYFFTNNSKSSINRLNRLLCPSLNRLLTSFILISSLQDKYNENHST